MPQGSAAICGSAGWRGTRAASRPRTAGPSSSLVSRAGCQPCGKIGPGVPKSAGGVPTARGLLVRFPGRPHNVMVPIGSAKGCDAIPMPSGPTWTGRGGSGRVNVMCGKADPRAPERVARARPLRRRHRFGSHRRCGGRRAPRFDADRPPTCLVVARRNHLASSLQTSSSADQRRESHRRINQPTETMYRASSSSPEPGRRARCDAERCIGIISPAWHLAVYG